MGGEWQKGCAEDASIAAELGGSNVGLAGRENAGIAGHRLAVDVAAFAESGKHTGREERPCGGHASSNDVEGQVEGIDEVGEREAEGEANFVEDAQGAFVAGSGELGDRGGGEMRGSVSIVRACGIEAEFAGEADDGGGRRIHFEATAGAARAGDSVGNDGAVAGFSGGAAHALPDAAIENDAAADAGAERVHDEGFDGVGAAGAEAALAIGGEGSIVADLNGAFESALEFRAKVEAVEAGQVGRVMENAEGQFDGTGAADADAEEIAVLLVDELANGGGHVVEDGVRASAEASGETDVVEEFARRGDGGDAEVGASQVHADGEGFHCERQLTMIREGSGETVARKWRDKQRRSGRAGNRISWCGRCPEWCDPLRGIQSRIDRAFGQQSQSQTKERSMQRTASAVWRGGLKDGKGTISSQSGVLKDTQYSFSTRFENGIGTNPEELIGAAHAGCFTMALSAQLGEANLKPESLETTADVKFEKTDGGFAITAIHLTTRAKVPGASAAAFETAANNAKNGCPISKLFKGNTQVTLDAQLV
jgi:osmotically inducible protein OsmC